MANVTISVPEAVLRRARARASREGTSVNALLRQELERYVDEDAGLAVAWDRFLTIAEEGGGGSGPGGRTWTRGDLQRPAVGSP